MSRRVFIPAALLVLTIVGVSSFVADETASAQSGSPARSWTPPRTPWGDPDIQGTYTNNDENGTPLEQPGDLKGRRLEEFGPKEMAALNAQRLARARASAGRIGGSAEEDTGAGPSHWYEHLDAANSQPWLVFDPPDGRVPPVNAEGQKRQQAAAAERKQAPRRGPADSYTDRSLYDRCITRGLPGSMMPAIYGNAYDITQAPGYVAIRYEMIHETRIVPLDNRAPVASVIRPYMGDARGRWDGTTLVIETTNLRTPYRNSSDRLKIVERFTPISEKKLRWEIRFEDPLTWDRSWAYSMPLTRNEDAPVVEYACHEGNRGLENILRAARMEEAAARK
jgi:hypothetical protein